jgi:hypothetical protein
MLTFACDTCKHGIVNTGISIASQFFCGFQEQIDTNIRRRWFMSKETYLWKFELDFGLGLAGDVSCLPNSQAFVQFNSTAHLCETRTVKYKARKVQTLGRAGAFYTKNSFGC